MTYETPVAWLICEPTCFLGLHIVDAPLHTKLPQMNRKTVFCVPEDSLE